jgi:hypothetical protein
VIYVDDHETEGIDELDDDMRTIDRHQLCATEEGDSPRLMRDKMDDETISTMNEATNKCSRFDTGGNSKGPPSKLALDTEDSPVGSTVSSMLFWTRQTTESKLSHHQD